MTQDMHVYGFKKRATSKMNRSTHTLSILLEQLRSSLGAGKEQLRRSLEAGKRQSGVRLVGNEVTARRQRDYGSSLTRLRLVIITLLTLMTFGATNALAQTVSDGMYYIKSGSVYKSPDGDYYLCPTENWIYFDNSAQYGYVTSDNGKPFMTSYRCKDHQDYDSDKAIWTIKKEKTENSIDYYSIRHTIDGRYLTYNTNLKSITKGSNNNRLRFHLETTSESPANNNNMLFSFLIPDNPNYYVIIPKANAGKYLCLTEGNVDELNGSTTTPTGSVKTDGPKGYEASIYGTLGIYTDKNDAN